MASGNTKNKRTNSKKSAASGTRGKQTTKKEAQAKQEELNRTKKDLTALVIAIVAIALFVAVVVPTDGVVTKAVSNALFMMFGLGAYVLPVALLLWAASFFIPATRKSGWRIAIGLGLIVVALLSLFAIFTPITNSVSVLFEADNLVARGGYLGAGIAWCLYTLFGQVISCIILFGFIIGGFIIIGFSISKSIDKTKDAVEDLRERRSIALENRAARKATRLLEEESSAEEDEDEENIYEQGTTMFDASQIQPVVLDCPKYEDIKTMAEDSSATTMLPQIPEEDIIASKPSSYNREDIFAVPAYDQYDSEVESHDNLETTPFDPLDNPNLNVPAQFDTTSFTQEFGEELYDAEAIFNAAAAENFALQNGALADGEEDSSDAEGSSASEKASGTNQTTRRKYDSKTLAPVEEDIKYVLPPISLLKRSTSAKRTSQDAVSKTAHALQDTLNDFGLSARVVGWTVGPTVTLFKIEMPAGVRLSKVTALQDDIALALAADAVRIFAPVPGTSYVGVEIPNAVRSDVNVADVLAYAEGKPLELAIGKNVEGEPILANLAEMPHLLIGGTTGSGKSVAINSMLISILMHATPDEVRMILIDPKRVELSLYNGIPHLYVPVVTEPKEASAALAWAVVEMERRLKIFQKAGARNIAGYNEMVETGTLDTDEEDPEKMPMIVIIIDELADLMMVSGKEVETSISRLAQLARAAGIHLIVATQRPSSNVVTGLIKANITNRIAFNVATNIDSRVILDVTGAEKLIGHGDMLFSRPEWNKPKRIQGCYVSEKEIESVVKFLIKQGTPDYHNEIFQTAAASSSSGSGSDNNGPHDPLIWEAADVVVTSGFGSTSGLQRRLKVGYSRAGRIMDELENLGIVGPPDGSKPREVLVDVEELEAIRMFDEQDQGY